jgi:hypothetical protein
MTGGIKNETGKGDRRDGPKCAPCPLETPVVGGIDKAWMLSDLKFHQEIARLDQRDAAEQGNPGFRGQIREPCDAAAGDSGIPQYLSRQFPAEKQQ